MAHSIPDTAKGETNVLVNRRPYRLINGKSNAVDEESKTLE